MQKALSIAGRAELTDLPTLAHQLLLFCSEALMGDALLVRMRAHSPAGFREARVAMCH